MQAIKNTGSEPERFSGTKRNIYAVVGVAKSLFHWGFIPVVIYLGKNY